MLSPPNILLILSDQHRYDCLGVNGHPLVQTPYLDQLAREGINFTGAYCPTPICTPARLSLLHGVWPSQHLAIANWDSEAPRPPDAGLSTFSQALRKVGYTLGYVGKWHAYPDKTPLDFGFSDYHPYDEYLTWRTAHGYTLLDEQNWYFGELDPHIPPEGSRLAWGAETTLNLIERYAEKSAPFFIRWDPTEPHLPNQVPEPYYSMYSPEMISPWQSFPDPLTDKPFIQAQMRRTWKVDHWTWERDWSPLVSRYLGEISLMDAQIGHLLDGLERLGLKENTLVIYSSDHGDMCGAHGMIDKHYVMYDDVVRVPLIARWPAVISPRRSSSSFISHSLDLAATFCHVAGAERPAHFQGQSLMPIFSETDDKIYHAQDSERKDIFAMYSGNQFGLYSQRMVRNHEWKYVWNATEQDELYHLSADPAEMTNLVHAPDHQAELQQLRKRLVEWMESVEDRLLNVWTRQQLLEELKS